MLLRNRLPAPQENLDISQYADIFTDWALKLRSPAEEIPRIAERELSSAAITQNVLGFYSVYLYGMIKTPSGGFIRDPFASKIVRANIYLPGHSLAEDIHTHGFDFISTVVQGGFGHDIIRDMQWSELPEVSEEEIMTFKYYRGHEVTPRFGGKNEVFIDALRPISKAHVDNLLEYERLERGQSYSMPMMEQFHRVTLGDIKQPVVTLFAKTVADKKSLFFRAAHLPNPEVEY
jgi:hypothetical protein